MYASNEILVVATPSKYSNTEGICYLQWWCRNYLPLWMLSPGRGPHWGKPTLGFFLPTSQLQPMHLLEQAFSSYSLFVWSSYINQGEGCRNTLQKQFLHICINFSIVYQYLSPLANSVSLLSGPPLLESLSPSPSPPICTQWQRLQFLQLPPFLTRQSLLVTIEWSWKIPGSHSMQIGQQPPPFVFWVLIRVSLFGPLPTAPPPPLEPKNEK